MKILSGDRWLRALCVLICWCLFTPACGEDEGADDQDDGIPAEIVGTVRLGIGAPPDLYVYGEEILVTFDRDPGEVTITYSGAPGPDVAGDGTTRVFVVLKQTIVLTWEGGSETLEYQTIFEQEVGPVLVATVPAVTGPPASAATVNADGIALGYNVRLWDPKRTIQTWWFTAHITDARGVTWTPQVPRRTYRTPEAPARQPVRGRRGVRRHHHRRRRVQRLVRLHGPAAVHLRVDA